VHETVFRPRSGEIKDGDGQGWRHDRSSVGPGRHPDRRTSDDLTGL